VSHSRTSEGQEKRCAIGAGATKESKGQRAAGQARDDIAAELIQLRRKLGDIYDRLGDLFGTLGLFSKEPRRLGGLFTLQPPSGAEVSSSAVDKDSQPQIVFVVRITKGLDGAMWVQIGDRDAVSITEGLVDVLVLLAADSDVRFAADDPFVGWKSRESIAARLGITKHALNQRTVRLREVLEKFRFNPGLVQRSRKGVRFGLHRNGTLVTERDAG